MRSAGGGLDEVTRLSNLSDPIRRRLYEYVASCSHPVVRDDAAAAAGISRTLAAYHLDKLADAGILAVSYARPAGRTGPGSGRPAKQYARIQQDLAVSVPPRNYRLLAKLLVEAVSTDDSGVVGPAVAKAAHEAGRASVADGTVISALCECGYEPVQTTAGDIELRNCPFHELMRQHPDLVCNLNLEFIRGMLEAAGDQPERAELCPAEGRCCVVVHPAPQSATSEEPLRWRGTRLPGPGAQPGRQSSYPSSL